MLPSCQQFIESRVRSIKHTAGYVAFLPQPVGSLPLAQNAWHCTSMTHFAYHYLGGLLARGVGSRHLRTCTCHVYVMYMYIRTLYVAHSGSHDQTSHYNLIGWSHMTAESARAQPTPFPRAGSGYEFEYTRNPVFYLAPLQFPR